MKIRIKGNSLRIRISKSEVETFCNTGLLEEKTDFGSSSFSYRLQATGDSEHLDAGFSNGSITLFVPKTLTDGWAENATVGFSHNKPLTDGGELFLLLEKDFKCIDNTMNEDQSDNYENPLHTCA